MKINPKNYMSFKFPSKDANNGTARTAVAAFIAQLDPTRGELDDIKTAVSEAVSNAIIHAYPDTIGDISIRVSIFEDNQISICVRDWGCGIKDVERACEPLFTTGGYDRSGMGFTIMESFMDSVKVTSSPGKGTSVTMRRRISTRTNQ